MTTSPSLTLSEVRARWARRLDELAALNAHVDGAKLVTAFLEDLNQVRSADPDEVLTVPAAAKETGYTAYHIRRLLRQGAIPNQGRKGAPLVRRSDLPAVKRTRTAPTSRLPKGTTVRTIRSKTQTARALIGSKER